MTMKKLVSAAVALAFATVAWDSSAQTTAGKFGEKGTIAVHAATGAPMLIATDSVSFGATPTLGLSTTRYSDPERCTPAGCTNSRVSVTGFYINPRVHFFAIDNLSIGGEVLFATFSGTVTTETTVGGAKRTTDRDLERAPTAFGLMPIIGYNIQVTDLFSIWPQGGIGFRRISSTDLNDVNNPNDDVDHARTWWFVNADVPLLLHLAPHFALGAGPGITVTLSETESQKTAARTESLSGYATTQFRWFNAHLIGWF
jgi:hypothetical protein